MADGLAIVLAHPSTGFRCLDCIAANGVDVVRSEQLDSLLTFGARQPPHWLFLEAVTPGERRTREAVRALTQAFPGTPLYLIASRPGPVPAGVTLLLWPAERDRLPGLLGAEEAASAPHEPACADPLIGRSAAMSALRAGLRRAAEVDSAVLLSGETGTGKEVAAHMVHRYSPRAGHPWITVNCAAIPENLLESEMFGHTRGAFTGAHRDRAGKLRAAHQGTLFLDEVGELGLRDQAKLLRAIETRAVSPLGSDRTERVDVRLVAATNQPLEQLIADKLFRRDLFYRLNVVRLHLPPLRQHKEDIPDLCAHFIAEFNRTFACQVAALDHEALDCLLAYDWPGNVRELRNAVEVAFINRNGPLLGREDLPEHVRAGARSSGERDRLIAALTRARWNKSVAARLLNCSRMTLYRKLRKHGLIEAGTEDALP